MTTTLPTTGSTVNAIARATRRMLDLQAQIRATTDRDARLPLETAWKATSDERGELVLTAIRADVDPDLLRWVIDQQSPVNRAWLDVVLAVCRYAEALQDAAAGGES
jgi:hypothetical protein